MNGLTGTIVLILTAVNPAAPVIYVFVLGACKSRWGLPRRCTRGRRRGGPRQPIWI